MRFFHILPLSAWEPYIAESRAVQAFDDMRHGIVEVVGRSQHIGHIECALCVLARMGQTENPS